MIMTFVRMGTSLSGWFIYTSGQLILGQILEEINKELLNVFEQLLSLIFASNPIIIRT